MVVVGGLNLGGSIEPVFNASTLVEMLSKKVLHTVLMLHQRSHTVERSARRRAYKVTFFYYSDPRDALIKGLRREPTRLETRM